MPGNLTAAALKKQAEMNGGAATLKTVQGGTLKVMEKDGKWMVQDEKATPPRSPSPTSTSPMA